MNDVQRKLLDYQKNNGLDEFKSRNQANNMYRTMNDQHDAIIEN